jgi:hypothetical protein
LKAGNGPVCGKKVWKKGFKILQKTKSFLTLPPRTTETVFPARLGGFKKKENTGAKDSWPQCELRLFFAKISSLKILKK